MILKQAISKLSYFGAEFLFHKKNCCSISRQIDQNVDTRSQLSKSFSTIIRNNYIMYRPYSKCSSLHETNPIFGNKDCKNNCHYSSSNLKPKMVVQPSKHFQGQTCLVGRNEVNHNHSCGSLERSDSPWKSGQDRKSVTYQLSRDGSCFLTLKHYQYQVRNKKFCNNISTNKGDQISTPLLSNVEYFELGNRSQCLSVFFYTHSLICLIPKV